MASATPAQIPIRGKGQDKCPDHQSDVVFFCKDCNGKLVCLECATSTHQGHKFEKLSDKASNMKIKIQDHVIHIENNELPIVKQNIKSIDDQIRKNSTHFKTLERKIRSQGKNLKVEIDILTEEFIDKCRTVERNNTDSLSRYKEELQNFLAALDQRLAKCKESLASGNNVLLIDVEKDTQSDLHRPQAPSFQTANFTSNRLSNKNLHEGFGTLTITGGVKNTMSQENQASHSYRSDDSTVISEFKRPAKVTSAVKAASGSVWVSHQQENYILLVNMKGELKHIAQVRSSVCDISVSPTTGNLWALCNSGTIYEVCGKTLTKRLVTDLRPLSLAVTPDNNVIVGTYGKLKMYNPAGDVLHFAPNIAVVCPYQITVCANNGDVALCDLDEKAFGGRNTPRVTVFGSNFELKYQYFGHLESQENEEFKSDYNPYDATFDSQGRLLVAAYSRRHCIEMLNREGKFLAVVSTDVLAPKTLALIQDGTLFVGFHNDTVQIIKYRL